VKWGPLEEGDISDRPFLDALFDRYRPTAVMHFAAYAYVGESVTDPGKYYRNNVGGTLTLLEAMRDHQVRSLVFSSTCATYGLPSRVPIPEDEPQQPINPYGASKLMVERILPDFDVAHGLKSIALRYFNAAGADPDGEIGERHDPETHLIPLALDAACGRGRLTVHGNDYPTPDGTCVRDYIHVSDLADAHVAALEWLLQHERDNLVLNCGYGKGLSVLEVLDAVDKANGSPIERVMEGRRGGDPPELVAGNARLLETLGWRPKYADIDLIVGDALNWERKLLARN
jgi:UDP-arabinose 4-epimerase